MHVFQCLESQLVGKLDCIHLLLLWFFLREKPWMGNSGIWDASWVKCKWLRYATSILMDKVVAAEWLECKCDVAHFYSDLSESVHTALLSWPVCALYQISPFTQQWQEFGGRGGGQRGGGGGGVFERACVACTNVCLLLLQNKSLTLNTALQWIPHHCWNSM